MLVEIKIEVSDQLLQKILENANNGVDMQEAAAAVGANIQLKVKAEALKLFLDILKAQKVDISEFITPQG